MVSKYEYIIGSLLIAIFSFFILKDKANTIITEEIIPIYTYRENFKIEEIKEDSKLNGKKAIEFKVSPNKTLFMIDKNVSDFYFSGLSQFIKVGNEYEITYSIDSVTNAKIVEQIVWKNKKYGVLSTQTTKKVTTVKPSLFNLLFYWFGIIVGVLFIFIKYLVTNKEYQKIIKAQIVSPNHLNVEVFPIISGVFIISRLNSKYVVDKKEKFELENVFEITSNSLKTRNLLGYKTYEFESIEYLVSKLEFSQSEHDKGSYFILSYYLKLNNKNNLKRIHTYTYRLSTSKEQEYEYIRQVNLKLVNTIALLLNKNYKILDKYQSTPLSIVSH